MEFIVKLAYFVTALILVQTTEINADESFFGIRMNNILGDVIDFEQFRGNGKATLLVVTSSASPQAESQMKALKKLYDHLKGMLHIVAIPTDEFEPLQSEMIAQVYKEKFHVDFIIAQKQPLHSDLWKWINSNSSEPFVKYLVDGSGALVESYPGNSTLDTAFVHIHDVITKGNHVTGTNCAQSKAVADKSKGDTGDVDANENDCESAIVEKNPSKFCPYLKVNKKD